VAGRLPEAQRDAPHVDLVAVSHGAVREGCVGVAAEDDLGSGARGEFAMPAHEVGVQVRLDDVLDLQVVRRALRKVLLDVSLRIDDCRFAFRADQIRSVCEATQVELFEVHKLLRKLCDVLIVMCNCMELIFSLRLLSDNSLRLRVSAVNLS
jgi:hypothetical protein